MMLMGSLYVFFIIIIVKFLILGITSFPCIKNNKCVAKTRSFLTDGLVWNEVLEFLFSAYTEIAFSCLIHSNKLTWNKNNMIVPNISWLFFCVITISLPIYLFYFLKKMYPKLHEQEV